MKRSFSQRRCKRPAQNGRALLCAAPYAREIQGSKASKNLPDARNRAPVPPFSRASSMRRLKGRSGESRGDRKPCLVSCPLLPSAVGTASPPPKAAMHTPCHGEYPLPGRAVFASSGAPLYRRKGIPSADGKEKKTSAEGIRKRLPFVKRAFFSCFTSAYAADFRNYSSTFT